MRLIYGFDPLCGWCFGLVPAMQAVIAAFPELPVHLALPGLVTGGRAGPYHLMEGYIRSASQRLQAVTGRAPSEAFFRLIADPAVIGQSAPPCLVLAAARAADHRAAVALAHAVTEAHFRDGADLNLWDSYLPLLAQCGLDLPAPPLHDPAAAAALWQAEAVHGIRSYPTLFWQDAEDNSIALPTEYDPVTLVAMVAARIAAGSGLRYA